MGTFPVPSKSLVVVTGCSSGIGFSTAVHLARKGVVVFAGVRKTQDGERIKKLSPNIIPVILDVTKSDQIKSAVVTVQKKLEEEGYTIIGLVNNAGYVEEGFVETQSMERMRKQIDVNLFGQIEVTQAFIPLMRKHGHKDIKPRIVFIGSILGIISIPFTGMYSSAKRALETMANGFRQELSTWGFKVIILEPGSIKTSIYDHFRVEEKKSLEQTDDLSHVDPEVVKVYSKKHNKSVESAKLLYKRGTGTHITDESIFFSLFGRHPCPRYLVGIDAYFINLADKLPDSLLDFFKSLGKK